MNYYQCSGLKTYGKPLTKIVWLAEFLTFHQQMIIKNLGTSFRHIRSVYCRNNYNSFVVLYSIPKFKRSQVTIICQVVPTKSRSVFPVSVYLFMPITVSVFQRTRCGRLWWIISQHRQQWLAPAGRGGRCYSWTTVPLWSRSQR